MAACQVQNSANGREFDAGMEHWGTMQPMTFIDMKHANEEIGSNYDVAKPEGVKLTYNNGEDGRKTHILIPCDHAAGPGLPKPPIKNDVESPPGTYTIVFPSQYGCLLPQAWQHLLPQEVRDTPAAPKNSPRTCAIFCWK